MATEIGTPVLAVSAGGVKAFAPSGMMGRYGPGFGVKLPEGWRVWLLVLVLNVLAGGLWFLDRDVARPAPGGSIWDAIRSLGGG